jgi:exo-beta-1,3-glucanase (GH17 family)
MSSASSRPRHRSAALRSALAWLVLCLLAAAAAIWWWLLGRPVPLPDAPSARIACVSYAPFRMQGETPLDPAAFISPERIDADLRALSQRFDCVRTYSQGQGLSAVPQIAQRYGMKVLLGIWLGGDPVANAQQVKLGIATAQTYPNVLRGVIVGNEVLLRGEQTSAQIAAYLHEVRRAVPASVPVTYADVWEFWLRHPELAGSVDYLTIHILPYWENEPVSPDRAVAHVADVVAKVKQAFPGRSVMIGETGWPSAGRTRQIADASIVNEARYLREFLIYAATANVPYNVIETFDQPWKRAQEGTAGGYWGIFDVHAQPKFPMRGPVIEDAGWWIGWVAGIAGAGLLLIIGCWDRRWKNARGFAVLTLAGFAIGGAVAWQGRQMSLACRNAWEWSISIAACVFALITAVRLVRWIAAHLAGIERQGAPAAWQRFAWLFGLAYYDLLLVFDGRYRDLPLGLFALPCIGYALVGWLSTRCDVEKPSAEQRVLAAMLPLLAIIMLMQEAGLSAVAWLWLGLNLALALPVLFDWRARRQLQAQQA